MVRLRVLKASKFVFECRSVDPADAAELQSLALVAVRTEVLDAMGIDEVNVLKRLHLDEVDRMIACCREYPPDVVVGPASQSDEDAFKAFARYLEDRQRAGVATLPNGYLLLLVPLPNMHSHLRCVAIMATTSSRGDVVAVTSVPKASLPTADSGNRQKQSDSLSLPAQSTDLGSRKRRRVEDVTTIKVDDSRNDGDATAASTDTKPGIDKCERQELDERAIEWLASVATVDAMNRRSRKSLFARLRMQQEAYLAYHYEVLREWSSHLPPQH